MSAYQSKEEDTRTERSLKGASNRHLDKNGNGDLEDIFKVKKTELWV